ncbi:MAG: Fe2+-dependent dioxygenase [Alphaproteobacteria bacterium]|nr:Fe2+-dependent dioxygenase [Alphaproteobacteria bacterium]
MLIEIPDVLTRGQVLDIRERLSRACFVDGALSAGAQASGVKRNTEIAGGELRMQLARDVCSALASNHQFNHFALPRRIMVPIFSRYEVGMTYGSHTDVALMGVDVPEHATRTDLSLTLFLSDPESYDGGELVIQTHVGENRFKLPAGRCVVYPSHNLHYVAPVSRGVRLAAVTWVQSFVRADAQREVLFELCNLSELAAGRDLGREGTDMLFNIYHKLTRMWADT